MVSIIGAGPVGNYLAYLLAKQGKEVNVYEDHNKIGEPIQCTGILTSEIDKIMNVSDKFVVNKIKKAKVYAPNGQSSVFDFNKPDIIVNRTKFDTHLAEMAEKEGAKIFLAHKYKGNNGKYLKINDKEIKTDYLIGADGPHSRVAKNNGLWCDRKFVFGNQVLVEDDNIIEDTMEIWLGLGLFSWSVPESKGITRVGLVTYDKPEEKLNKLLEKFEGKVVGRQGGHIPVYNPKQKLQNGFVSLIGDAAMQVKPTSYGGIVLGMKAAGAMAKDMNNYESDCKRIIGKDLYMSHMIRKVMDKFSMQEYDELVAMFNQDKIKKVLENNSRDVPSKFALQLFMKEPRLLKYGLKLF